MKIIHVQTRTRHLDKGYILKVDEKDCFEVDCTRELYLPHYPVLQPHKSCKVHCVLDEAAKNHDTSLETAVLNQLDLLKNLFHVLICFWHYQYAILKACFCKLVLFQKTNRLLVFCGCRTQLAKLLCTCTCVQFLEQKIHQHAPTMS